MVKVCLGAPWGDQVLGGAVMWALCWAWWGAGGFLVSPEGWGLTAGVASVPSGYQQWGVGDSSHGWVTKAIGG